MAQNVFAATHKAVHEVSSTDIRLWMREEKWEQLRANLHPAVFADIKPKSMDSTPSVDRLPLNLMMPRNLKKDNGVEAFEAALQAAIQENSSYVNTFRTQRRQNSLFEVAVWEKNQEWNKKLTSKYNQVLALLRKYVKLDYNDAVVNNPFNFIDPVEMRKPGGFDKFAQALDDAVKKYPAYVDHFQTTTEQRSLLHIANYNKDQFRKDPKLGPIYQRVAILLEQRCILPPDQQKVHWFIPKQKSWRGNGSSLNSNFVID